jgi:cell wall-associated NlpC family hydrolase
MKKVILLNIIVILLILFNTACSSTSSSVRYGSQTEKKEDIDNSVRFTSKENNAEPKEEVSEEFDEIPPKINPELKNRLKNDIEQYSNFTPEVTEREQILFEIIKYIDTPYKYGGNDHKGIDCSAFTQNVFSKSTDVVLPRSASQQFQLGDKINKTELQFGDLVFFNTTKRSFPGHVGIYVGENLFAHASFTLGVTISSLSEEYYSRRFVGARRIK